MDNRSSTPGPSHADQSLFERWRDKFTAMTVGTPEERVAAMHEHHHKKCEKWKGELMTYSPAVVFMLKHLKQTGADVTSDDIVCAPCDFARAGGFNPAGVIVLCQDKLMSKSHMEDTMVHELVHMYDHVKFKVDWDNLRHHACSEIRANSLSGDCRWSREFRRGFLSFSKQHQECVRRRAVLSVRANPACPDQATAERAVNEVWDSCFNDTRPFDEIY
ncbi:peptidase M76 family-domain-containing protein [Dichomitus squalens]|uniref:Mitochondrial inner membrane protease ATP23 n=2 Tax=Dichomitus squalens TaxID=114155 RepID=A0A4Q9Q4C3_9APHY|nr:peptidase M76 family-domain-containing protein [Dichomitus squalens]TBU50002.1 peptidase M76 family-domain-containing protein [Dichomitus squalens]TBU62162.1 peptidase M76 family-domain-containing protein [Dichomitus squalens]